MTTSKPGEQANEGEGNQTAARAFNKAQTEFAHSGKVQQASEDAVVAVDGPEAEDRRQAEQAGQQHSHSEDPD